MSKVTDIFIHRPVLSSALSLLILLMGIAAWCHMPLRLFPKIISPVILIQTTYAGASGHVMNSHVTSVIQNALSGIENVNYQTASSAQNTSEIRLYMELGSDPQAALSAVMTKLSSIAGQLPKEADKPIITVSDSDADPAMILAATSHQLERYEVADYLRREIAPALEAVNGVSEAQVLGRTYAIRLSLDPLKMAARGLVPQDVLQAVQRDNVLAAAGKATANHSYFDIQAATSLHTPEDFNEIILKTQAGANVLLKDVGHATAGDRNADISAFYQGKPASMIFIKLLPGANPLEVTDAIKKMLPHIISTLPYDIKLHPVLDSGRYIHEAIQEVVKTLFITIFIVIAVIYIFLGSLRAMIISVITIPLSLFGVCIFLLLLKFSINTLTLLAMVIAIGLVVDDAIVLIENIFRHLEKGIAPFQAALSGAREMAYPVIAMSITLAAVYLPMGMAGGLTGQLFQEFAFTLAMSVMLSGFVALTLSPMLCSRWLTLPKNKRTLFQNHYESLLNFYQKILRTSLSYVANQSVMAAIGCGLCVLTILLFAFIPHELAPAEDQGFLMSISSAPNYTNSHFLNSEVQDWMKALHDFKEHDAEIVVTGIPEPHRALSFISLKEWGERKETAMELQPTLQKIANTIPGLQTVVFNPASLPGSSELPLQIVLKSTTNYMALYSIAQKIMGEAWESGLFHFIKSDLQFDQPVLKMEINRKAASTLGISMQQISTVLNLMLSGSKVQQFVHGDQVHFVISEAEAKYQLSSAELNQLHLKTASGKLVPLSSIAAWHKTVEPEHWNQFQRFHAITISGEMAGQHSIMEGVRFFKQKAAEAVPPVMLDYAGETRQLMAESHRVLKIFIAAIIVILIVLAIQFECYRSAIVIVLGTAPLAMFAACIPLALGYGTLNIYTEMGLLTLIGLITKHGILMTEFANTLQQEGLNKIDAIVKAASLRFRPILMTTTAMVFGLMPLAFATGAGSASRSELGIVLAFGMLLGTVLVLILFPATYLFLGPERKA